MPRATEITTAVLFSVMTTVTLTQTDAVPPPPPPRPVLKVFADPPKPVALPIPSATPGKADDDPRTVLLSVRLIEQRGPTTAPSETKKSTSHPVPSKEPPFPEFNVMPLPPAGSDRSEGFLTKAEVADFLKSCQANPRNQILAAPTLLLPMGKKGQFRSGCEYMYDVPTNTNAETEVIAAESRKTTIFIGTSLDATVTAPKPGLLRIELTAEQSTLSSKKIEPGLPPAKTSRGLQTVAECPIGQSVVLRGLKATHQTASVTRVPVLGELPVLDSVFSKKRMESEEVEFVVLITAELVDEPPQ